MKLLYANDTPGEHACSWYASTTSAATYPPLEAHLDTDVCVVGAGLTGLSAALELARSGISCVVLEAHRVGWGASGRNGGQLGSGFNMDQLELESLLGKSTAHELWQIAEDAKSWIHDTCNRAGVDIEYRPGIVTAAHRQRFVKPLHEYCEYMQTHYRYSQLQTLDAQTIRQRVQSDNYYGGAIDHGAGHVHPLKLTQVLAKEAVAAGVRIAEQSEVTQILQRHDHVSKRVVTATGSVSCQNLILACNGYIDALDTVTSKRIMPINNFIVVTEPLGERAKHILPFNDAVADSRFVVNYYRRVENNRLLFGGGENYAYRFPQHIAPLVRKAMLGVFPQLHDVAIDYAWGGTLAITRNRLPYINQIQPGQYTAGGYSGHGVALACGYGKALAHHLAGNSDVYNTLAMLPNTPFPGGVASRSALLAAAMTTYSWLDAV